MQLFPYLCLSVIFCALVLVVQASQSKAGKIVPTLVIVGEVFLLLQREDLIDLPFGSESWIRSFVCAVVAVTVFVDLMRQSEKAFALLAFFASLTQLLVSLEVVSGVTL